MSMANKIEGENGVGMGLVWVIVRARKRDGPFG